MDMAQAQVPGYVPYPGGKIKEDKQDTQYCGKDRYRELEVERPWAHDDYEREASPKRSPAELAKRQAEDNLLLVL